MAAKNRFSYNLAVNNSITTSYSENNQNSAHQPAIDGDKDEHHHLNFTQQFTNEKMNNSRKMHQKSSSSGSSILFDAFSDLEEEELSTVNEDLSWLLPGENFVHRELNVGYYKQDKPEKVVLGRVYVTNYRLRFEERFVPGKTREELIQIDVTLGSVSKTEKMGYQSVQRNKAGARTPYGIKITCKDVRDIQLIHRRKSHARRALFECVRKYSFPNTNRLPFFASLYKEQFRHDGWKLFDVVSEFRRQRVPNSAWCLTRINKRYEFTGTYPALFYVPAEVYQLDSPEEFLHSVSEFRSKKRIPVLSWINPHTSAALVRSSQPMVGALARKSASDEDYLEMIINANAQHSSGHHHHLVILDARPSINAKANRANGGGYEVDYSQCELKFMDIQNIHAVRDSLKKLKEACFPRIRQKHFQRTLEETKWLAHLQTILEAAAMAAREITMMRTSVLVHCSDGWDRTAQITSLAMLQLDPYYRTIEGFAVLIEKEWCSFGHKFAHRIGHGQDRPEDKERSPIFVQFIDCVWQLYNLFTSAFQFNVRFLKMILDELYSCRFGTFLYNCERERIELQVKQNTASLWSFVLDNRMHFFNEKYNPEATLDDFVMQRTKIYPLFWTDYYCRYSQLLPPDKDDQVSLVGSIAGSIGPATPIGSNFSSHQQKMSFFGSKDGDLSNNKEYVNCVSSTNRDDEHSSNPSTPTPARPQKQPPPIPPETPARQRRWQQQMSSMSPQQQSSPMLVSELKQQFLSGGISSTAPTILSSPGSNRSSSMDSTDQVTRV